MARRRGLAALLVERGIFGDVRQASSWIMARKVRVGDAYVTKPGALVAPDARVDVVGLEQRYVGRGGLKLEAALERFAVSVDGLCALDAGASTGGFTDCLLQAGAARVYAVDVGFGQLRGSLASDPRVVALERTNIGDLRRQDLDPVPDVCTADLSYLSLEKSLPILARLVGPPVRIVHLVKPLFEGVPAGRARRRRDLAAMLRRVVGYAPAAGLAVTRLAASPLLGSSGTVEFLALVEGGGARPIAVDDAIDEALRQADAVAGLEPG